MDRIFIISYDDALVINRISQTVKDSAQQFLSNPDGQTTAG